MLTDKGRERQIENYKSFQFPRVWPRAGKMREWTERHRSCSCDRSGESENKRDREAEADR